MRLSGPFALCTALALAACGPPPATVDMPDLSNVTCAMGKTNCGGTCADLATSIVNCGMCGMHCRYGDLCMGGKCVLVCANGLVPCGDPTSCVNTFRDPAHCGGCGMACPAGNACDHGACVLSCQAGLTDCAGTCTSLDTDAAHCGDCVKVCPKGNVCVAGACSLTCQAGLSICTTAQGPSCINLQTDDAHCGDCATACAMGSVCVKGKCAGTCGMNLVDCGGGCTSIANDPANCGACGKACGKNQVCLAGTCTPPCVLPLVTCQNACADPRFDPSNCGGCGKACSTPNAAPACLGGTCVIGKCAAGYFDCDQLAVNGCEVNGNTDLQNCLGCGKACAPAHGVGLCKMGCTLGSCLNGYADCNGDPSDGCEISLATDILNCNMCGVVCPAVSNGTPGCSAGVCGIGMCKAGRADCNMMAGDGCEVDLTADSKNCGACGLVCAGVANATVTCSTGKCKVGACNMGYVDCNGLAGDGCECNTGGGYVCLAGACLPISCNALHKSQPAKPDGVYALSPDGVNQFNAYCDMTTAGGGWTLVLKMTGGSLCFANANWTMQAPLNEAATLDATVPAAGTADAKSRAFYSLTDVTSLRFVTTHAPVVVSFASPSSPMNLMTTNNIPFAPYPDYTAWKAAFLQDRCGAPIFMRAGITVTNGNICRSNPGITPVGCGQLCTFCFQASDTCCCGCNAGGNDVSSGVGLNLTYCGGGIANCSSAGSWSDPAQRTLVWGR